MPPPEKQRLDLALVDRGLVRSRAQARDLVLRGLVTVDGEDADKPARIVEAAAQLALIADVAHHVSRGAEKLAHGLVAFGFSANKRVALDLGASTGGFTQTLLDDGAAKVFAVDAGRDQLHPRLRAHPRVVTIEGVDARTLDATLIPEPITVITADLSFISLTKALDPALRLAAPGAWLIALVKPQFEVGRDAIGKGGIVRDDAARRDAVTSVETWLVARGEWRSAGSVASPIAGGDGNQEFLLGAVRI